MFIPSQGLRHAATLLLINGVRTIPTGSSPESICSALGRLADEMTALADDMRAPAAAAHWLIAEFHATIDRLPCSFDRQRAKMAAASVIARVGSRTADTEPRDVFLIYAPEDRLPLAAPLAVALMKRRVSVAFAEYEAATPAQFGAALELGMLRHLGGVILWADMFEGAQPEPRALPCGRLRILRRLDGDPNVPELMAWVVKLRAERVAK
jgi:hypothetical protein